MCMVKRSVAVLKPYVGAAAICRVYIDANRQIIFGTAVFGGIDAERQIGDSIQRWQLCLQDK